MFKLRRDPCCCRDGFSLMEMVTVLSLLGVMILVTATYSTGTLGNLGAKVEARRVSLDLIQARRRAIATGDNHLLQFAKSGSSILSYQIMRRLDDNSMVAVDDVYLFPADVAVASRAIAAEFDFEGSASAGYSINFNGSDRSYQVVVDILTGTVRVSELRRISGRITPIGIISDSPVSISR